MTDDQFERIKKGLNFHSEGGVYNLCTLTETTLRTIIEDAVKFYEKQQKIDALHIMELQKQNGELTDELKALRESIKDYGAGCYENGLRNGRRKLEAQVQKATDEGYARTLQTIQLTKAKDLLKQWLQTSKASGCDNINIVTDTEQFLKDNEVEK